MTKKTKSKTYEFSANKFKEERKKQGWTLGKFAEKLLEFSPKASKALVYNWDHGKSPSLEYMMAICKILNKTPDHFAK